MVYSKEKATERVSHVPYKKDKYGWNSKIFTQNPKNELGYYKEAGYGVK